MTPTTESKKRCKQLFESLSGLPVDCRGDYCYGALRAVIEQARTLREAKRWLADLVDARARVAAELER